MIEHRQTNPLRFWLLYFAGRPSSTSAGVNSSLMLSSGVRNRSTGLAHRHGLLAGFVTALLGLLLAGPSRAQSCSLAITSMNFGSPAVLSGAPVDSTATITASCTNYAAANICVGLDAGSGGLSGFTRLMTGPSGSLRYNLYQDAARTIPWGSRTNPGLGSIPYKALSGSSNFTVTETIYGRLYAGQSAAALGSYSSNFSGAAAEAYALTSGTNCASGPATASIYGGFSVLATVSPDCTVTSSALVFPSLGLITSVVDATTSLAVRCTSSTAYSVGLNNGGAGTGPTNRKMTAGGNSITYGLYRDAARSQPWGATSGLTASGTGTGSDQSFTVYGRVPAPQSPPPGSYSDTIVISVAY